MCLSSLVQTQYFTCDIMRKTSLFLFGILLFGTLFGQEGSELMDEIKALREQINSLRHEFDQIDKGVDDLMWYNKVGDVAFIDKVRLTGPPLGKKKYQATEGRGNPLFYENPYRIQTYLFIPKDIDVTKKYPLMVLPHGGVHSNFNTFYAHIIRELIAQGYIVVAPEYRGSTGYGGGYYRAIDYGGLEVKDVKACRDYMIESYDIVDPKRVGIMGWSHGGLITLMNLYNHAEMHMRWAMRVFRLVTSLPGWATKPSVIGTCILLIIILERVPTKIQRSTRSVPPPGRPISSKRLYWSIPIPMTAM